MSMPLRERCRAVLPAPAGSATQTECWLHASETGIVAVASGAVRFAGSRLRLSALPIVCCAGSGAQPERMNACLQLFHNPKNPLTG